MRCVGGFIRSSNLLSVSNAGTTEGMARKPERSKIVREPQKAFARRLRADGKEEGDDDGTASDPKSEGKPESEPKAMDTLEA